MSGHLSDKVHRRCHNTSTLFAIVASSFCLWLFCLDSSSAIHQEHGGVLLLAVSHLSVSSFLLLLLEGNTLVRPISVEIDRCCNMGKF